MILNEDEDEIVISYRQYKISETDFGNFLHVKKNTESIYFGSIILPRVFTLIASGKMSKFKSIEVDVNPENEFNIKNFKGEEILNIRFLKIFGVHIVSNTRNSLSTSVYQISTTERRYRRFAVKY